MIVPTNPPRPEDAHARRPRARATREAGQTSRSRDPAARAGHHTVSGGDSADDPYPDRK